MTGGSQEERAKRTRGVEMEHEIKKLRDKDNTINRKSGKRFCYYRNKAGVICNYKVYSP
jgi:hypothetical protein